MKFIILFSLLAVAMAGPTSSPEVITAPSDVPPLTFDRVPEFGYDFWYGYFLGRKHGYQDAVQTFTNRQPAKPNCKPVGAYCTYHEDCCSRACLGYLGKCVSH